MLGTGVGSSGLWLRGRGITFTHHTREAKESGADPTDYTTSPTARSFVPFYAQRLSAACVLNGARAIQKSLKRKADRRRSAATAA